MRVEALLHSNDVLQTVFSRWRVCGYEALKKRMLKYDSAIVSAPWRNADELWAAKINAIEGLSGRLSTLSNINPPLVLDSLENFTKAVVYIIVELRGKWPNTLGQHYDEDLSYLIQVYGQRKSDCGLVVFFGVHWNEPSLLSHVLQFKATSLVEIISSVRDITVSLYICANTQWGRLTVWDSSVIYFPLRG